MGDDAFSSKLLLTETHVLCWQSQGTCEHEQQDNQLPCCPASISKCHLQKVAFDLQGSVILVPAGQLLVGVVLSV